MDLMMKRAVCMYDMQANYLTMLSNETTPEHQAWVDELPEPEVLFSDM